MWISVTTSHSHVVYIGIYLISQVSCTLTRLYSWLSLNYVLKLILRIATLRMPFEPSVPSLGKKKVFQNLFSFLHTALYLALFNFRLYCFHVSSENTDLKVFKWLLFNLSSPISVLVIQTGTVHLLQICFDVLPCEGSIQSFSFVLLCRIFQSPDSVNSFSII